MKSSRDLKNDSSVQLVSEIPRNMSVLLVFLCSDCVTPLQQALKRRNITTDFWPKREPKRPR